MPILVSTSGVSSILSIGSGVFSGIKPLFFLLIAVFLGLGLFEFILGLFKAPKINKEINITEDRRFNSALSEVSTTFKNYIAVAGALGIPFSRAERKELKSEEVKAKKRLLLAEFGKLKEKMTAFGVKLKS